MICPACFHETFNNGVCSHCGFDENAPLSPLMLPPGTALLNGQYLVGKILGKPGGFGITYLGWDSQLATFVAIKEYLPRDLAGRHHDHLTVSAHTSGDTEHFKYGLEQFLHEARTLAQFDHPNVVRVRSFFQENGTAYLVMDYLEGVNLADHLANRGGRLTEKEALDLINPVLNGLKEVHAKGFLHRDIKPQNIYITTSGRPILLDFGTARQAMGNRGMTTVLTPGYAPWEQYHRHGKQGAWTDIYACAATLYQLVTGNIPPESADRVAKDELVRPSQMFTGISQSFDLAVTRALSIDPAGRPQTVAEFQAMLSGAVPPPVQAPPQSFWTPNNMQPPPSSIQQPPPISPPPVSPQQVAPPVAPPPPPMQPPVDGRWVSQGTPPPQQMPPSQNIPPMHAGPPMQPPPISPPPYMGNPPPGPFPPPPSQPKSKTGKVLIGVGVVIVLVLGGIGLSYGNMNGYKTMTYNQGTYEGNVSWNSPHGQGKITYSDGSVYVGNFESGKRSGKGTLRNSAGASYEGDWKDDRFDGKGVLISKDKSKYTGDFKAGKRSGQGVMVFADGRQYSGQWLDDKADGNGTLTLKDGTKYVGAFKEDLFHGQGTLTSPNGDQYVGGFAKGVKSGKGVFSYADKKKYEGNYENDKRSGQGTMHWASGTKYVGEWKDDKRHGQGRQSLMNNGQIIAEYIGEYRDDVPYSIDGQYKIELKDGRIVMGTYRNGSFYWNN